MSVPPEEPNQDPLLPAISRRGVLAASSIALAGAPASVKAMETTDSPEDVLLTRDDLLAPDGEEYVRWDGAEAPLLSAFRHTVPGFGATPAAGRGFLTAAGTASPAIVESGAVSLEGSSVEALVEATTRWVRQRVDDQHSVSVRRASTGIQWRTRNDETLDVVHLHRGGGYLLVTMASGDEDATIDPASAVSRYVRTMRQKARR